MSIPLSFSVLLLAQSPATEPDCSCMEVCYQLAERPAAAGPGAGPPAPGPVEEVCYSQTGTSDGSGGCEYGDLSPGNCPTVVTKKDPPDPADPVDQVDPVGEDEALAQAFERLGRREVTRKPAGTEIDSDAVPLLVRTPMVAGGVPLALFEDELKSASLPNRLRTGYEVTENFRGAAAEEFTPLPETVIVDGKEVPSVEKLNDHALRVRVAVDEPDPGRGVTVRRVRAFTVRTSRPVR